MSPRENSDQPAHSNRLIRIFTGRILDIQECILHEENEDWSDCVEAQIDIMKTSLFKYTENFTTKNENFSDKNSDIFHISAQNIDCRYSLEPPRRGGSNE